MKEEEEEAARIELEPEPESLEDPEDVHRIISEYQRGFNEARLEFGSTLVATPARKMSARAKGRVLGRYNRLGPDRTEWDDVDVAAADLGVVAEEMERGVLFSLNTLNLEGASSVMGEAIMRDELVNTKWSEEQAVLAVVGYTYAALMFERLLEMGQIDRMKHDTVQQKVENSQMRIEELSVMVDGAALRAALDTAEQHWFVGRLRAGVVPGQIAQQARQYQAHKRRLDADAATASGRAEAPPVLIPVAGAPLDGVVLRRWFEAAKAGELMVLRTMVERWPPLLTRASAGVENTALHWAAAKGHASAVQLLIKSGAPLEQQNFSGATPLHSAAANGEQAGARALLSAGASHAVTDYADQTPHDAALSRGCNDVVKLIAHFGLARRMDAQRQRGTPLSTLTALHKAPTQDQLNEGVLPAHACLYPASVRLLLPCICTPCRRGFEPERLD